MLLLVSKMSSMWWAWLSMLHSVERSRGDADEAVSFLDAHSR